MPAPDRPLRLLVVMPSWVGDAVMATPALRLLRQELRGSLIGALVRPGIDQVLAGSGFFDQIHTDRAVGVMGPKNVAARLRPHRYDTALLLTNSFSTALITRLAWIPRRVGYDRDARGLLLTDRIKPLRRGTGRAFAPVPQVDYYLTAARALLRGCDADLASASGEPAPILSLGVTGQERAAADTILTRASPPLLPDRPLVILNPGANDAPKRWPADRFAAVAVHLARSLGMNVLVNGSPAESDLVADILSLAAAIDSTATPLPIASLPALGVTIGSLKSLVHRAALLITNDTGPRHIAAAFGIPTITLFGPTDPRWTTLPNSERTITLVADPSLPPELVADDYPARCRIDRITTEQVIDATHKLVPAPARP